MGAELPGRLLVENQTQSPFGTGWTLAGLERLFEQPDGSLVLTDGTGNIQRFAFSALEAVEGEAMVVQAPPSLVPGAFVDDGSFRILQEAQAVTPTGPIPLDNVYPLGAPGGNFRADWTDLPAGLAVNAFLIHADRPANTADPRVEGTITFPSLILGVIYGDENLDVTDALFAVPGTSYPTGQPRGIEQPTPDSLFITPDRRSLIVSLDGLGDLDQVRVITAGETETVIESSFDSDLEGWTDVGAGNLSFQATGGNPGGHGLGDDSGGGVWFWSAPAKFLGDLTPFLGGLLTFDQRQDRLTSAFQCADVRLFSALGILGYGNPYNPMLDWTSYPVPLALGPGWSLNGATPTAEEFESVLSAVTAINLCGEFVFSTINDFSRLDNVRLVTFTGEAGASEVLAPPPAAFTNLSRNEDGSFTRTNPDGTRIDYDLDGRIAAETDRNGNATSYGYDPVTGNLTSITDPAGLETTFLYDANDRLANVVDPAGRTTAYIYDAQGRLTGVVDAEDFERLFAYDADGRLDTATDQRGFETDYDYGFAGQLLGSDLPDGASISQSIFRDLGLADLSIGQGTPSNPAPYARPGGLETTVTDGNGNLTRIKLDEFGGVVEITDALGRTTSLERDDNGLPTKITQVSDGQLPDGSVPGVVVTELAYDDSGNVTLQREAAGTSLERETRFEYEPLFNRVTKITDPAGNDTLFEYDANGNLERQIDPENGPATPARVSTWDSRGLELTRTDANGNSTTWTYDAKGNQETETDGEGSITSITRDGAGRITEHTEGMGTIEARSVSLSYDDMNRIESVVDANGGETTFDYDKAGNRIAMNLPGFPAETRGYDEMNRVVHFDSPLVGETTWVFDPAGNIERQTDPNGNSTLFGYDAFNRMISREDAATGLRTFAYDADDNQVAVTDARGKTTDFAFDPLGRMVARENALGQVWEMAYDSRDNLTSVLDPKVQNITRSYDALSRLTGIVTPDNTITFTYDPAGNRIRASDDNSALAFSYDRENRLLTQETLGGGIQPLETLTSGYDSLGNRTSLEQTGGAPWSYQFDGRGFMTRLTTPASQDITLGFLANGGLEEILFPNGVATSLTYRAADGRIESLTHETATATLLDLAYGYDAAGNVNAITEDGASQSIGYDVLQQVTAAGLPAALESYDYDPEGNRETSHRSALHDVNDANRLLEDDAFVYTYDANGNLKSKIDQATLETTTYTWDAQDQLTRIDFPGGGFADYKYDALGRRIQKDVDGSVTSYLYDGENIAIEYDGSGTEQARYSHGDQVDQPLAMERGGESYYYQVDHLGSVRLLTDATGAVANSYAYDAYGNFTSLSETVANPTHTPPGNTMPNRGCITIGRAISIPTRADSSPKIRQRLSDFSC